MYRIPISKNSDEKIGLRYFVAMTLSFDRDIMTGIAKNA